jgi:hypothetical protein
VTRAADRTADRRLARDGCFNVRDLGGLPAAGLTQADLDALRTRTLGAAPAPA